MNIVDTLAQLATGFGSSSAISDEEGEMSFSQLFAAVEQTEQSLAQQGIAAGMLVGIKIKNSRWFIVALLAVLKRNAVAVPIGIEVPEAELINFVQSIPLHGVCTQHAGNSIVYASLPQEGQTITHVHNPAVIRPTSGTTGQSKGVIFSHESLLERLEAGQAHLQLTSSDRILWVLPMAHHFIVSILLYLKVGACIVVCKNILADAILDHAHKHGATYLYATPYHYALLAQDTSGKELPLRYAVSTASGLSEEVNQKFFKRYGIRIKEIFGIIECGLPIGRTEGVSEGALGVVAPGFEVRLFGQEPDLDFGELGVRGPGMFDGYLNPPLTRQQVLSNGWFMTGDMARRYSDGSFSIIGRKKSVIITVGNKVFPEEVEAVINVHPKVKLSKVFSKPHPAFGEIVACRIMLKDPDALLKEAELKAFCKQRLASYKIPQHIEYVTSIEMTATGKVART